MILISIISANTELNSGGQLLEVNPLSPLGFFL